MPLNHLPCPERLNLDLAADPADPGVPGRVLLPRHLADRAAEESDRHGAVRGGRASTDWLDGYLARTLDQTSAFGAFLDPVADKLMVAAALILLVWLARVDAPIAVIIIGREIAISALREWMAKIGKSRSVAVSFLGKVKTGRQMAAILLLLYHGDLFGVLDTQKLGTLLIYIAAGADAVVDGVLPEDGDAVRAWEAGVRGRARGGAYLDTAGRLPIIHLFVFARE